VILRKWFLKCNRSVGWLFSIFQYSMKMHDFTVKCDVFYCRPDTLHLELKHLEIFLYIFMLHLFDWFTRNLIYNFKVRFLGVFTVVEQSGRRFRPMSALLYTVAIDLSRIQTRYCLTFEESQFH